MESMHEKTPRSSDKDTAQINKRYRPIWEFTYKIVSGEDMERVKVVRSRSR